MFALKKIIAALILPPTGLLFVALLGLWLSRRHPKLGRALASVSIVSVLVLSLPWVATRMAHSIEPYPALSSAQLLEAQAIVILGGGTYYNAPEYGGDVAGHASLERIRYGAWLYRATPRPILVTGGAPFSGVAEGRLMAQALQKEFGVPVRWIEDQSRDTVENAKLSAKILKEAGITRIALISHASHLARAVPLFERESLNVLPAPTVLTQDSDSSMENWLPNAKALATSRNVLNEWLGSLVNRLAQ